MTAKVPADADEYALSDFDSGDMFADAASGDESVDTLVGAISGFLGASSRGVCVLEGYPGTPKDPCLAERDSKWNGFNSEVYVLLDGSSPAEEVKRSVFFAQKWAFTACLSSLPEERGIPPLYEDVPLLLMAAVAERAEIIVVGAYDSSGYLYWAPGNAPASAYGGA